MIKRLLLVLLASAVSASAQTSAFGVKAAPTIMPMNTQNVTRAPPQRSATQPVAARLIAPTSGPRNTYFSTLTSGNWLLASSGRPAEKPMNEPNVPV